MYVCKGPGDVTVDESDAYADRPSRNIAFIDRVRRIWFTRPLGPAILV